MKKTIILYIFILFSCFFIIGCDYYPPGKDTIALFGNGRFQILKSEKTKANPVGINVLNDGEKEKDLLWFVENWDNEGDWIYAVGRRRRDDVGHKNVYIFINLKTGSSEYYSNSKDIPRRYQDVFMGLRKK